MLAERLTPNFFAVLGYTPPTLSIEAEDLRARYTHALQTVHPDKGGAVLAGQQAVLLNDAYRVLKHPLRRLEHFLDVTTNTKKNISLDSTLLPDVLAQREELEEAQTLAELESLHANLQKRLSGYEQQAQTLFHEQNKEALQTLALSWRYADALREAIRQKKRKMLA
jgi:Fe-S protein assembly co-chaperone HscB